MPMLQRRRKELLSAALHPHRHQPLNVPYVDGMITYEERHALACFAKNIWDDGAPRDALIVDSGRSLLIHQDFVYPFYPWVILSMGQLVDFFSFAYTVPWSSVVFDVSRKIRERDIEDPRNIPLQTALKIYDRFIALLEGWGQGAVALGKASYLASLNRVDEARPLIDEVAVKFAHESLVTQYLDSIRKYCDGVISRGAPIPLDEAVGI